MKRSIKFIICFVLIASVIVIPCFATGLTDLSPSCMEARYYNTVDVPFVISSGSSFASGQTNKFDLTYMANPGTSYTSIPAGQKVSYNDLDGYVDYGFRLQNTGFTLDEGSYVLSGLCYIAGKPFCISTNPNSLIFSVDFDPGISGLFFYDAKGNPIGKQFSDFVITDSGYQLKSKVSSSNTRWTVRFEYFFSFKCKVNINSLNINEFRVAGIPTSKVSFYYSSAITNYFPPATDLSNLSLQTGLKWSFTSNTGSIDTSYLGSMADSLSGIDTSVSQILGSMANSDYYLQLIASYLDGSSSANTLIKQIADISNDSKNSLLATYQLFVGLNSTVGGIASKITEFETAFLSFSQQQLQDNQTIISDLLLIKAEVEKQGQAIVSKLQEIIDALNEAFGEASQAVDDTANDLNSAESGLINGVGSDFEYESASTDMAAIGTGGFTFLNAVIERFFSECPIFLSIIVIFLMLWVAKATFRSD